MARGSQPVIPMRGSFLLLFPLVVACTSGTADDEAAAESENASSSSNDDHARAITECNAVYAAQPGTSPEEALIAAQHLETCARIANNHVILAMARRTRPNGVIVALDAYRDSSEVMCAAFFDLDGPAVRTHCIARREVLLAQLLDAHADFGQRRVAITLSNNAYRRCSVEGRLDLGCADAQLREDVSTIVRFRPDDAIPVFQRAMFVAQDTCRALANANVATACAVDALGMTMVIGRTTRR
jgi:hypothetical protein